MILVGSALEKLKELESESVQCCITSPPYWALRNYQTDSLVWGGNKPPCVVHKFNKVPPRRRREASEVKYTVGSKQHTNAGATHDLPETDICSVCGAWKGSLGLEPTPELFVQHIVEIFREVKRVLRDDGTLWLNLGDSYASGKGTCYNPGGGEKSLGQQRKKKGAHPLNRGNKSTLAVSKLKPKDLCGIPWMVAFALRADGWYLRSDIIWSKPNPMPESVTDRPTKSHEYIFLLTKSERYYYDAETIKEPIKETSFARLAQDIESQEGSDRVPGKTNGKMKAVKFGGNKLCPDTRLQSGKELNPKQGGGGTGFKGHSGYLGPDGKLIGSLMANKKTVWRIATQGFKEAHFATFPEEIPRLCISAGTSNMGCCAKCGNPMEREVEHENATSKPTTRIVKERNDRGRTEFLGNKNILKGWKRTCSCNVGIVGCTVLDPFAGAGTTLWVAKRMGRRFVGIELNPKYVTEIIEPRLKSIDPLFAISE